MNGTLFVAAIFLPLLFALPIPLVKWKRETHWMIYTEALVLLTSVLVLYSIGHSDGQMHLLFHFANDLDIGFRIDGLASVFVALVSVLWPLATLYAFEYMKELSNRQIFFMFYVMTFGVTLGIAFSGNILTMYCFYEMLTIVTLPLIMHTLTREAIAACRTYLLYSLGGAAFAFIGMVFILYYGATGDFTPGGVFLAPGIASKQEMLLIVYVLTFFGFSVKAAMWPFGGWLPKAGVAPTPVTALLHAVAVVKAGAFALMRVTYYSFGAEFLRGTWAQTTVLVFVLITIVYGCSRALKETHLKRRLAYSTMSNLSYILFGVVLMSPLGLIGALCHMIFHAFMKICSFFCVGAVMHQTHKNYVHEINGFGRKMPVVFTIFTISGLALMGVPGLPGFISKWNLAKAAVANTHPLALVGVFALLVSALLTALYMMSISFRAFLPGKDFDDSTIRDVRDPGWMMLVPLVIFVIVMLILGLHSGPLVDIFQQIASEL
ncbi:MAG: proton-conducting transporter membrane subunit [bacterium]|nr:proton-conducting transporter membrane subunit [bacterium]MDY4099207.1 proton-conducting transporter membrane subunit [Lachnospiraceae bacterium]